MPQSLLFQIELSAKTSFILKIENYICRDKGNVNAVNDDYIAGVKYNFTRKPNQIANENKAQEKNTLSADTFRFPRLINRNRPRQAETNQHYRL